MASGFTPEQTQWLQDAVAKKGDFAADEKRRGQKAAVLKDVLHAVRSMTDDLIEAHKFEVSWTKEEKGLWSRLTKTKAKTKTKKMNWSEGDRDEEVDTVHDLVDGYQVESEAAQKVQKMHRKLIMLQTELETREDTDGNPLFTAQDIERELWSPLVKSNIIPSNAVADEYSEEARVFHGACEIYAEQLKKYTKTASKHEKAKRRMSMAMDTVNMMGALGTQVIKAANFDSVSMSAKEKRIKLDLKAKESELQETSGNPDAKLPGSEGKDLKALNEKVSAAKKASKDELCLTLFLGLTNGAYDIVDKSLDKADKKKNWEIAEKAFTALAEAVVLVIQIDAKGTADHKGEKDYKTMNAAAQHLIRMYMAGAKIGFRFHEILEAPSEKRIGIAQKLIASTAEAVSNAFAAFDEQDGKNKAGDKVAGTKGKWAKAGAVAAGAIITTANAGEIVKRLHDGKVTQKSLGAAMGLNVVTAIMMGTLDTLSDAVRTQVKTDQISTGVMEETNDTEDFTADERAARLKAQVGDLKDMTKELEGISKLFDTDSRNKNVDSAKLEAMTTAAINAVEKENRDKGMAAIQNMQENQELKKKFEEDLQKETAESQATIMDLISEATPTPDDMEDQEKARKAMAAMDKLIAESEACKMKWKVIDQLTAGGARVLLRFLPAAGLAVAIRKLAMDTALLVKKSTELNLWYKNTALTYGNDSVYGPAIKGRLASAKIQTSQKAVNVIFSIAGVTTESLKLADVTGISSAMSISTAMARALSDYGYKWQQRSAIIQGWRLYKQTQERENQGDRKLAREAMQWNSTLSKCVLAYGIVEGHDPICMKVARRCGMTPEVLQDQHDVCQKVVHYFMSVYSDDPVVLKRIPLTKGWHPGTLVVTLESWLRFKVAAKAKAKPRLDEKSTDTRAIDKCLTQLESLCQGEPGYETRRDEYLKAIEAGGKDAAGHETAYDKFLKEASGAAKGLIKSLDGYFPRNGPVPKEVKGEERWTEGLVHEGMLAIADSLRAQTVVFKSEIEYDRQVQKTSREDAIKGIDLTELTEWEDYHFTLKDFRDHGPPSDKDHDFEENWKRLKAASKAFMNTKEFQALPDDEGKRETANINNEIEDAKKLYDKWAASSKSKSDGEAPKQPSDPAKPTRKSPKKPSASKRKVETSSPQEPAKPKSKSDGEASKQPSDPAKPTRKSPKKPTSKPG